MLWFIFFLLSVRMELCDLIDAKDNLQLSILIDQDDYLLQHSDDDIMLLISYILKGIKHANTQVRGNALQPFEGSEFDDSFYTMLRTTLLRTTVCTHFLLLSALYLCLKQVCLGG